MKFLKDYPLSSIQIVVNNLSNLNWSVLVDGKPYFVYEDEDYEFLRDRMNYFILNRLKFEKRF